MSITKITYVNGVTVIGANNLNEIQDEIIANASNIATNASDIDTLQREVGENTDDITAIGGSITNAQIDALFS